MTREDYIRKVHKQFNSCTNNQVHKFTKLINEIFDDFKSRTCNNCKFLDKDTGKSYSKCDILQVTIGCDTANEFYCSFFERRKR